MTDKRLGVSVSLMAAAILVSGCNAGPLLKTGSLLPANNAAQATPKPATPVDRALHAGATVARAQKCGFFFDAATVRTNFLAAEAQRGTPPDMLAKTTKSYDYTTVTIAQKIKDSDDYCSDARTTKIKSDLGKLLAGNFDAPIRKPEKNSGGFLADLLETDNTEKQVFNPDHIYDPLLNDKPTKKAE